MKSLILAEKPSVARDIARVLGCRRQIEGGIEGNQYIVTWALGHLVTLADPEEYNSGYKEWKLDSLPMIPDKWELVVIKATAKQYRFVKSLLFRKDIADIIIATDAGREGELVARWILDKSGCHKPTKRLWISSVTDKAIQEGFKNLKDASVYIPLYHAAKSRAEADWLVGINATRALTCKYNAQLSCGRVQTPTLAIIAQREAEIKAFSAQNYFGLECTAHTIKWTWINDKNGSTRSFNEEFIKDLSLKLQSHQLTVTEVKKSAKKTYAPGLYDLTELQRDANKRFGFSAKETLNIMQRLYENHKVLTYPRTDSRYIGTDVVPTIKERLRACAVGPYAKIASRLHKSPIKLSKSYVDDSKVSDHHAIIPTEEYVQLDHMTNEERKIYDLVVRRFISVLYPPFEYEQTTLKATACCHTFAASGKVILAPGWREVYDNHWEEDEGADSGTTLTSQPLPLLTQNSSAAVSHISVTAGKTKPPAKFTEATLLSAMENPSRYMDSDDEKAKKTLGETGGLGTVATRADIIEKLFHSFLLEKKGKEICITSKGKQLLELVPSDLKKPELTASWEMKLSLIAKGEAKSTAFLQEIQGYTKDLIREIKQGEGTFRHENLTNNKCPQCGKRMLTVNGKNARLLVCQDRECGHRETVARISNARCPNCHKKMELVKKNDVETFVCACGYKEKLSAFKSRREKEGAGVSKKDVQTYLKQQEKSEAPVNNAFADALAKLKL